MLDPAQRFVGRAFGAYEVLAEIARGGQGAVVHARHRELGTEVALKVLLSNDPTSVARFQQEARLLARLEHPSLLSVTDLGTVEGTAFLAMKFLTGSDLKVRVARGGVPDVSWSAEVLASVAEALHYCHSQGVLHRDVKPANVLIEELTKRPVLVDFGLAKPDPELWMSQVQALSLSGEMKGTPAFMAPEQIDGVDAGPPTDVYGLGATLYFLLTGFMPFLGATPINVISAVLSHPPPDPRAHNPQVSPEVAELCVQSMAKAPEERPATAEAFAIALRAAAAAPRASDSRRRILLALVAVALVVLGWGAFRSASSQRKVVSSPSPSSKARPEWFTRLDAARRPPLPLPEGLRIGTQPGEFVNAKDDSILVWVPPAAMFMGKYEVTWEKYRRYCLEAGIIPDSTRAAYPRLQVRGDYPVFNVNLEQAAAYCEWAGLRLPTAVEWELAARKAEGRYPWGNEPVGITRANVGLGRRRPGEPHMPDGTDGHLHTAPVGSYPAGASRDGCLDMAGNVWEWVDFKDPELGEDRNRRCYGGSWINRRERAETHRFNPSKVGLSHCFLGFRVACSHETR